MQDHEIPKLFSHHPRIVYKPWGREVVWAEGNGYTGKRLIVLQGKSLSLQYHTEKHETLLLWRGEARINNEYMDQYLPYVIPPMALHRIYAVTDCEILEVSTPEIGMTHRLHDHYGRGHELL